MCVCVCVGQFVICLSFSGLLVLAYLLYTYHVVIWPLPYVLICAGVFGIITAKEAVTFEMM